MDNMKMFIPMQKVDEEKRLVYGIATQEILDKSNEVMDYETSKPLFEKWSNDISKATDGKSLGNVREMHTSKAAGKLTDMLYDDDSKTIEVCAKVVDEDSWNKVKEGVLTGFSIGGSYQKRWKDNGVTKFTASPVEISLVDNPCVATATFQVIKADGVTEERKFKNIMDMDSIKKSVLDNFNKAIENNDLEKAFSFEDITERVNMALNGNVTPPFDCGYFYIKKTFPDFVIIKLCTRSEEKLYKIMYTIDDMGNVTIGDVTQVQVEFVPVTDGNTNKSVEDEDLQKRKFSTDERKKMAESGEAMPDGSYPIKTAQDVKNAVKAWGRGGAKPADKKHIIARAKAIGAESSLPDDWTAKSTKKSVEDDNLQKQGEDGMAKEVLEQLKKMNESISELTKSVGEVKDEKDDQATAADSADLNKSADDGSENEELAKAVKGFNNLKKVFDDLKLRNEALEKQVKTLEDTPKAGGPISPDALAVQKSLGTGDDNQVSDFEEHYKSLQKQRDEEQDEVIKSSIGVELATMEMKKLYGAK